MTPFQIPEFWFIRFIRFIRTMQNNLLFYTCKWVFSASSEYENNVSDYKN